MKRPVLVPHDPDLLAALEACLRGWPVARSAFDPLTPPDPRPLCVVEPRGVGRFCVHSAYVGTPMDGLSLATTVCALLADLSQAWCDGRGTGGLGLHCGAVVLGGQTILLAGERRAGKSTLVARLSAEPGVTVLCDDVLPVDASGAAVALGIAPRLRLPLPGAASGAFRAHVARWGGPADDRYGYLLAPGLAAHGSAHLADTFVLLDRRAEGPATLHRMEEADTLRHLLKRSISGPETVDQTFATATALAGRLRGLTLVYADLEEAVDLLSATFAADGRGAEGVILPPLPPGDRAAQVSRAPVDPARRYRCAPGVVTRRIGSAAYLWRPDGTMLWELNPVAQAVWTLLEVPGSAEELAGDLREVFTAVDPAALTRDICALLAGLAEEELVQAMPVSRPRPPPLHAV